MEVKVLSWNIWVNSKYDLVKQFLSDANADVIGLQEVSGNDPTRDTVEFLASLGYQAVFAPQQRPWAKNNRSDGPAIFTKYQIVDSKKYVLSSEFGVGAVRADLQVNDRLVHFFSTHLSHTHQQDSEAQLAQIQQLLAVIPHDSSVLLGDFNAIPTSQTIQLVQQTLVNVDLGNHPTWSVYPEGCEVCLPQTIDTRLDYIFTTRDISTRAYQVESSRGSDHLPISVIAEI